MALFCGKLLAWGFFGESKLSSVNLKFVKPQAHMKAAHSSVATPSSLSSSLST